MPKFVALFTAAIAALTIACTQDAQVGDNAQNEENGQCLSDGEPGQPCRATSDCCADGTFCYYEEPCNVETEDGCYTEGWCRELLAIGEECSDPSECAEPEATCSGPLDGPATCTVHSEDLDGQRCEESSDCSSADGIMRVCHQTYCLRKNGEQCSASDQCASNRCSGTTGYTCS